MVFSSDVPAIYLDPPHWEQKIPNQPPSGIIPSDPLQIPQTGPGSIKPGSMVDRARLAMVPLPEAGLRCPRCDSTNTKFCYFNNYNLTQPRHFCKTCRRYWTRGGTLRNVPVGGRCRRNKRRKPKKGDGSKTQTPVQISTSASDLSSQVLLPPPPPPPDPFLSGFNHLNGYVNGFGLNWGGGGEVEYESGVSRSVEQLSSLLAGSGVSGNGLYPFYESGMDRTNSLSGFGQLARVKGEENHQGLSLSKNLMVGGIQGYGTDHQYSSWGAANAWTAASNSGFHSSSSGHQ